MCGTETGKRVKDKTVTGPTMGLTCNKGEPKVRPFLSFYRCTAYFAAGMKGPIIIHICKKEGFPFVIRAYHTHWFYCFQTISCPACHSYSSRFGFSLKLIKKLERDMAEETHVLLKNPYN